jgi:L-seryl-tRNA(Ser) seleniumtransferase
LNIDWLRLLPSVDALLNDKKASSLLEKFGREAVLSAARNILDEFRRAIVEAPSGVRKEEDLSRERILDLVHNYLEEKFVPSLDRAINATGIIMHSGLGRAVLSEEAREALQNTARGYCRLALDRESGRRSQRDNHVSGLLAELTGAEAATVVNNNAAATILILNSIARGKEVIISRGQLVEIGGSFRMPDVMTMSGATLTEVGTTNKTHLHDYADAVNENTGAIMRVHHSNYRILGFAEEPGIAELCELGKERGLPVVDDLGSGALVDLRDYGLEAEPMVQMSIQAGASMACFSGDKLIGGPQSGIIVGRAEFIDRLKKNPLARAFRCGKLTLAALEATLKLFLVPEKLRERHPIYRMLSLKVEELETRAHQVLINVRGFLEGKAQVRMEDGESQMGSGSVPVETIPTKLLSLRPTSISAESLARKLRYFQPPVFSRVHRDSVLLDFRTIQPDEDSLVEKAILEVFKESA